MTMTDGKCDSSAASKSEQDLIAIVSGRLAVPPAYFMFTIPESLAADFRFVYRAQRVNVDELYGEALSGWRQGRHAPWSVYRSLVESQAALIHQHWATWSAPAVLASRRLDVPLVVSVHGYDAFLPKTPGRLGRGKDLLKRLERRAALDAANAVVVNSGYMAERLRDLGVDHGKVRLIRHGVDTELFRSRGLRRSGILFVGRLSPEKGATLLIRALAHLAPEEYDSLTLVGVGPEAGAIRELARRLRVRVRMLGQLNRIQVAEEMSRARVVVVPSVPRGAQQEGSGLVPLEAQASGAITVVTRVGGLHENLPGGMQALVAEPVSADLARAISEGLALSGVEESARVRDHVLRHHSHERVAHNFKRLYEELLA